MAPAGTVVEGQQGVGGKSVNDAHDGPVNGTSKPKVCYKCQKEGHIARNCPLLADG